MTSGEYFNKGVKPLDSPCVGHAVRKTDDKIVVFGHYDYRFDIPKSERVAAEANNLLSLLLLLYSDIWYFHRCTRVFISYPLFFIVLFSLEYF